MHMTIDEGFSSPSMQIKSSGKKTKSGKKAKSPSKRKQSPTKVDGLPSNIQLQRNFDLDINEAGRKLNTESYTLEGIAGMVNINK